MRNSYAIAHKRQRKSSQKKLVARHFPLFSRVLRRNYCAIAVQLLNITELLRYYCATIAPLPATPFTPTPIPLLRHRTSELNYPYSRPPHHHLLQRCLSESLLEVCRATCIETSIRHCLACRARCLSMVLRCKMLDRPTISLTTCTP